MARPALPGRRARGTCPHQRSLNGCDLLIKGEECLWKASRRRGSTPGPGAGGWELPSPHHLTKGQLDKTGTGVLGACRAPSSLRGVTHCIHIPISAPPLSVPCCSMARHAWGPLSWPLQLARACGREAVELTPMGGQLFQEKVAESCFFLLNV